jgi:hypothetical protein
MSFTQSKIADRGTANPIVSRLTLQIFNILDQCNLPQQTRDGIKLIYIDSLRKKLLRCWEIVERYRTAFSKELRGLQAAAEEHHDSRYSSRHRARGGVPQFSL